MCIYYSLFVKCVGLFPRKASPSLVMESAYLYLLNFSVYCITLCQKYVFDRQVAYIAYLYYFGHVSVDN